MIPYIYQRNACQVQKPGIRIATLASTTFGNSARTYCELPEIPPGGHRHADFSSSNKSQNPWCRIGDITLPGTKSEAMAIDHAGAKLYVNLRGPDEIGVVDLATRQLIARWPIPEAKNENALVLDEPNHRLFSASHTPPKLFVFDIDTGKVIASLPCAENSDDMGYDPVRKRIFITGDGSTSVIVQQDADHYVSVAELPTGYRAKTSIFVPELNRLYIAVSSRGKRAGGNLVAPEPGSKGEVRTY